MLPDLQLDDKVRLRKPHPCGSYEWKVVRLGADIGIECLGCRRRVLLPRRQLARRIKTLLAGKDPAPEPPRSTAMPFFDVSSAQQRTDSAASNPFSITDDSESA